MRIIIAWNNALPLRRGDISYHRATNRYSISLIILNSLNEPLVITPANKIETYDFNVNVSIYSFNAYIIFIFFI